MTNAFVAEFIGTMLLVLFGNGVVANVSLAKTKGFSSGWIVIAAGWGIAVFIAAFCSKEASGAHLNPAVTLAMVLADELAVTKAGSYVAAQMMGAMAGALLVYLFYREHFNVTDDKNAKLGCFSTSPSIRNLPQAFLCEVIGTFALILPIFLMADPSLVQPSGATTGEAILGLGSLGLLPVGLLVFGIGLSLGGTTGYAINPARDLGPRLMHALLPIRNKRDSDWSYAWVPVLGPLVGGVLAAAVHRLVS
jgi:glycerol uptake facilitator protein